MIPFLVSLCPCLVLSLDQFRNQIPTHCLAMVVLEESLQPRQVWANLKSGLQHLKKWRKVTFKNGNDLIAFFESENLRKLDLVRLLESRASIFDSVVEQCFHFLFALGQKSHRLRQRIPVFECLRKRISRNWFFFLCGSFFEIPQNFF